MMFSVLKAFCGAQSHKITEIMHNINISIKLILIFFFFPLHITSLIFYLKPFIDTIHVIHIIGQFLRSPTHVHQHVLLIFFPRFN